jgi:hypothetical protein
VHIFILHWFIYCGTLILFSISKLLWIQVLSLLIQKMCWQLRQFLWEFKVLLCFRLVWWRFKHIPHLKYNLKLEICACCVTTWWIFHTNLYLHNSYKHLKNLLETFTNSFHVGRACVIPLCLLSLLFTWFFSPVLYCFFYDDFRSFFSITYLQNCCNLSISEKGDKKNLNLAIKPWLLRMFSK